MTRLPARRPVTDCAADPAYARLVSVNPFLAPSPLPFGYPDFDAIREEHFAPAFAAGHGRAARRGRRDHRRPRAADVREHDRRAGALRGDAASGLGGVLHPGRLVQHARGSGPSRPRSPRSWPRTPTRSPSTRRCSPASTALYAARHELDLDPESLRLLERRHRDAVRAGARLGPAEQDRLRALNAELSALSTEFGTPAAGRGERLRGPRRRPGAARRAVPGRGLGRRPGRRGPRPGRLPDHPGAAHRQPALASLTDRGAARAGARARRSPAARAATSTTPARSSLRMAALRAERARLLGHPHHASWVVEIGTAGTVEAVDAMLGKLAPVAAANARAEAAELAAAAGHPIEAVGPRLLRRAGPARALRPRRRRAAPVLRAGAGAARRRLPRRRPALRAALRRAPRPAALPPGRAGVRRVRRATGQLGLFVADLYARDSKRGGAWMNSFVTQSHLLGTRPVVLNTLNIASPADGEPTLLTLDNVRTLFHEFGHALHGLFSDVRYPTFSGTGGAARLRRVPLAGQRDVAGRPARSSAHYARHHRTGEPLPAELVARLAEARARSARASPPPSTWPRRCSTRPGTGWPGRPGRPTSSGSRPTRSPRPASTCRSAPPRYRSTYFNHVFGGGYSAGYYSYIWSEVLDADTVEWFAENGGLRRENGERVPPRAARPRRRRRPDGGLPRVPRPRPGDRPAAGPPRPGRLSGSAPTRAGGAVPFGPSVRPPARPGRGSWGRARRRSVRRGRAVD